MWVKAHAGIQGNEEADKMTKNHFKAGRSKKQYLTQQNRSKAFNIRSMQWKMEVLLGHVRLSNIIIRYKGALSKEEEKK